MELPNTHYGLSELIHEGLVKSKKDGKKIEVAERRE
jgi:predicted transcriptional regulator